MSDIFSENGCLTAMSGFVSVKVAKLQDVKRIDCVGFGKKKVVFKSGLGFADFRGENMQLNSDLNGRVWKHLVSTDVNGLSIGITAIFDELKKSRLVVVLRDLNGQDWIVGSKKFPLRFTYKVENVSPYAGQNRFVCEFFGDSVDSVCGVEL